MLDRRRAFQLALATLGVLLIAAPFDAFAQAKPSVKVRYTEVVRSILYAPAYVAIANGYFKDAGLDVEYLMLRGIFTVPGASRDVVDYYVGLLRKVRDTPEWKALINEGAFNATFMTGPDYAKWVETEERRHQALMKEAGFLAGQ